MKDFDPSQRSFFLKSIETILTIKALRCSFRYETEPEQKGADQKSNTVQKLKEKNCQKKQMFYRNSAFLGKKSFRGLQVHSSRNDTRQQNEDPYVLCRTNSSFRFWLQFSSSTTFTFLPKISCTRLHKSSTSCLKLFLTLPPSPPQPLDSLVRANRHRSVQMTEAHVTRLQSKWPARRRPCMAIKSSKLAH